MEILSLNPEGFRNLAGGRIEFHPRLNLIVGDNGQGKTNLLEALAVVSGRISFRTADLAEVIRAGEMRGQLTAKVRRADEQSFLTVPKSRSSGAMVRQLVAIDAVRAMGTSWVGFVTIRTFAPDSRRSTISAAPLRLARSWKG